MHPPPHPPIDVIRGEASRIAGFDAGALPRRWEKVGDVLLLRPPPDLAPWGDAIGRIYANVLGASTVVEDRARIHGPWRVPDIRRLWGDGTETVHVENGVRFKLDVAKVMFSSGNVGERGRMARIARPGETVVDLFAGIGYFSIPIAVHGQPSRVVSCEVNPTAFHYLQENIRLNRAGAVEARLGDCREVAPAGVADRVIMGHFGSVGYLPVAFRAMKDLATIHLHALLRRPAGEGPVAAPAAGAPDPLFDRIRMEAESSGFRVDSLTMRRVKSYGPHRVHVVVDAEFIST